MGTNYYFRYNICDSCNSYKERHLGKNSFGWKFVFKSYPNHHDRPVIKSIHDWEQFFEEHPKGKIFDEYGREHSLKEFWDMVETKQKDKHQLYNRTDWMDGEYVFCSNEFS